MALKIILVFQSLTWIAFAAVPQSRHVWLITEENHSYENVMGNMPYLVSLANKYGLASQSYADMHNSISALMHLVAGQTVTTNDTTTSIFNVDNLAGRVHDAGLTWRAYQESLPYAGDTTVAAYPYVKRHNPLAYFTDTNTSSQRVNWVPYPANLEQVQAANFNYVTPNLLHDAHDGTMQAADTWLQQHIPAILSRPEFLPGGDGIMIITFDEGNINTDSRCSATISTGCGGRIFTVVIGPQVRRGFISNTWHNHESVLKTVCEALGLGTCPGAAQTANDLREFFDSPAQQASTVRCEAQAANLTVTLCSPASDAHLTNAVRFQAATTDQAHPVHAMVIYVDGVLRYHTYSGTLDTVLTIAPGGHNVVVRAWDTSGAYFSTTASIQVDGCAPSSRPGVRICSPEAGQTLDNPVHVVASGGSNLPITGMTVYVDNVKRFWTPAARIDTFLTLTSGSHLIRTRAWDSSGAFFDDSMVVGTF